jgi:hypothetical protein
MLDEATLDTNAGQADILTTSNDDTLLRRASQFHAANDAEDAFYNASIETADSDLRAHLLTTAMRHGKHAERLAGVICAIQASGLAGALVQIETLRALESMCIEGELYDRLSAAARSSVEGVLRRAVGDDAGRAENPVGADVAAAVNAWKVRVRLV